MYGCAYHSTAWQRWWSIVVLAVVVLLQEAFGHLGPGYGVPEAGLARSAAWRVIGGTDAADRGGSPAWIASASTGGSPG